MVTAEWQVPWLYLRRSRGSFGDLKAEWGCQRGAPAVWMLTEVEQQLFVKAVGTRLGVDHFRKWILLHWAGTGSGDEAALKAMPLRICEESGDAAAGFTYVEKNWQGSCRWPGCPEESLRTSQTERRRHEA